MSYTFIDAGSKNFGIYSMQTATFEKIAMKLKEEIYFTERKGGITSAEEIKLRKSINSVMQILV